MITKAATSVASTGRQGLLVDYLTAWKQAREGQGQHWKRSQRCVGPWIWGSPQRRGRVVGSEGSQATGVSSLERCCSLAPGGPALLVFRSSCP